jgi:hypothetical protein
MRDLTWRTDEPCPLCGTGLFRLEGLDSMRFEWRTCGNTLPLTGSDIEVLDALDRPAASGARAGSD